MDRRFLIDIIAGLTLVMMTEIVLVVLGFGVYAGGFFGVVVGVVTEMRCVEEAKL